MWLPGLVYLLGSARLSKLERWGACRGGRKPSRRHDHGGLDAERLAVAGERAVKGALIQNKGDWLEYVVTYGVQRWSHMTHPSAVFRLFSAV